MKTKSYSFLESISQKGAHQKLKNQKPSPKGQSADLDKEEFSVKVEEEWNEPASLVAMSQDRPSKNQFLQIN